MTMSANGEEMNLEEILAQAGESNPLDALRGRRFTQTFDRLGNLIDSDYALIADDPALSQWSGGQNQDLMQQVMESVGSAVCLMGQSAQALSGRASSAFPDSMGHSPRAQADLPGSTPSATDQMAIIQRVITFDNSHANAPPPPWKCTGRRSPPHTTACGFGWRWSSSSTSPPVDGSATTAT